MEGKDLASTKVTRRVSQPDLIRVSLVTFIFSSRNGYLSRLWRVSYIVFFAKRAEERRGEGAQNERKVGKAGSKEVLCGL